MYKCPNCGEFFAMINETKGYCLPCDIHWDLDDLETQDDDEIPEGRVFDWESFMWIDE